MQEGANSVDTVASQLSRLAASGAAASAKGIYTLECYDSEGNLKWTTKLPNLVVNGGVLDMNTKYFTGSAYTAAWYIGLYGAGATNSPNATDTMASHGAQGAGGWTEVVPYSNATRPQCVFGTATTANPSVISNSASVAAFTINATATVGGAFLTSNNTKSGATGILFSASDFAAPGDRSVASGDTLNVTYQFSLTGA